MKEYLKEWKLNNPTYFREYGMNNREKLTDYHAKWVEKNKTSYRNYQKKYYIKKKLKEQNEKIEAFKKSLEKTEVNFG